MLNTREIASEYRLAHWSQIMQDRAASGLSILAYCKAEGIYPNRYHYWQKKLREAAVIALSDQDDRVKEIHPVKACPPISSPTPKGWAICEPKAQPMEESTLQIEIGKSRVTADAKTNLELLAKVCQMLMSLC